MTAPTDARQPSDSDSTVLIAGAGPVGLTAALTLARAGVDVRIIDKRSGPSVYSKALGVAPRTLEILEQMDVAASIVADSQTVRGSRLWRDGGQVASVGFDQERSVFDLRFLPQSHTEQHLLHTLESIGVHVSWNTELVQLEQESDGCRVAIVGHDGTFDTSFDWVIGCDGGRSFVRQNLGISFDGEDLEGGLFVLADVRFDDVWEDVNIHTSVDHVVASFPLPDGWTRLISCVDDSGVIDTPQATIDVLKSELAGAGVASHIVEYGWTSTFRLRSRLARRYRVGRVFIAGDAAHTHSPLGGQGMNLGIQDAHNLGWKLAGVLQGRFAPSILDTYEQERRPIAQKVVDATHRATRWVMLRRDRLSIGSMRAGAVMVDRFEAIHDRVMGQAMGLDQRYGGSNIVDEDACGFIRPPVAEKPTYAEIVQFRMGAAAGTRAPDCVVLNRNDTPVRIYDLFEESRHTVLFFDGRGESQQGYDQMVAIRDALEASAPGVFSFAVVSSAPEVASRQTGLPAFADPGYVAHQAYGARAESAYVVRPDGMIGYRQQPLETGAVLAWAATWWQDSAHDRIEHGTGSGDAEDRHHREVGGRRHRHVPG